MVQVVTDAISGFGSFLFGPEPWGPLCQQVVDAESKVS